MSGQWRQFMSWNKYTQVASKALRQSLNETERVAAEKRAQVGVKYQIWQNGSGGETQFVVPPKKETGLPPV